MAPGKEKSSMADLAASHLMHLNRNPGIEAYEGAKKFSVTSRQLLANTELFGENNYLTYRQRANGTVLIQCVDFFAEFMPGQSEVAAARLDDENYGDQFWELIQDMYPYKHVGSTRNVFKLLHEFLMNGRRNFKIKNPGRQLRDITTGEKFFLECLDQHEAHRTYGFSHAQLKYGQRRDDDFAVRLATRVRQWRDLTSSPSKLGALLSNWPVLGMDIAPVDEWDNEFLEDANLFSTRFRKPALQLRSASSIAHPSDESVDDNELLLVRHLSIKVATLIGVATEVKESINNIKRYAANISDDVVEPEGDVVDINDDIADIKKDVANMKEDFQALKESNDGIFEAVDSLKTLFIEARKQDVGRDAAKKEKSNKRPRVPE